MLKRLFEMNTDKKKTVKKKKIIHGEIKKYGRDILESPGFIQSANSVQHGTMSVRQHSIDVAKCSLHICRKLPFNFEERDLVRGALLHDYFQYDWHNKKTQIRNLKSFRKLHGFSHPAIALLNARKEFKLTEREEDIIGKHMWPLTIKPPLCREAWIVTLADKYCSLLETLRFRNGDLAR